MIARKGKLPWKVRHSYKVHICTSNRQSQPRPLPKKQEQLNFPPKCSFEADAASDTHLNSITTIPLILQTMPWEVTPTVLTAIFGSTILVCLLWGIHRHLLPHLRQRTLENTTPLPLSNTIGPTLTSANHHHLRSSLYSNPSINFIDPRNSIAGTELMSSRWSTSIHDLDPRPSPTSPRSLASPKSRRLTSPRPRSLMSVMVGSPGSPLPRSPCIHFDAASTPGVLRSPKALYARSQSRPEYRKRSQSDSLLERSHAALYGYDLGCKNGKSMSPELTGSTLQGSATPRSGQGRSRSAVYTANTSKIRSPLPR